MLMIRNITSILPKQGNRNSRKKVEVKSGRVLRTSFSVSYLSTDFLERLSGGNLGKGRGSSPSNFFPAPLLFS